MAAKRVTAAQAPIAVSMGDPLGVGIDCILAALSPRSRLVTGSAVERRAGAERVAHKLAADIIGDIVVYGARHWIEERAATLGVTLELRAAFDPADPAASANPPNPPNPPDPAANPADPSNHADPADLAADPAASAIAAGGYQGGNQGRGTNQAVRLRLRECSGRGDSAGQASISAVERAAADVLAGRCRALVTAPIHKADVVAAGWSWRDHTSFLASAWGKSTHVPCRAAEIADATFGEHGDDGTTMLFVLGDLRVGLCTLHVPLCEVPALITPHRVLTHIIRLHDGMREGFGIAEPTIAVCGLNPHAGEGGLLGYEDEGSIAPAVAAARALGWRVQGPLPADGLFGSGVFDEFDAVLAMYHDQGLTAIKALAGTAAVQTTLGVPQIRTSPGHGTARDLAGTGRASADGLIAALELAAKLSRGK